MGTPYYILSLLSLRAEKGAVVTCHPPLCAHDAPSPVFVVESRKPFFRRLLERQRAYLRATKRVLVLDGSSSRCRAGGALPPTREHE